jgi:hypothetical protein
MHILTTDNICIQPAVQNDCIIDSAWPTAQGSTYGVKCLWEANKSYQPFHARDEFCGQWFSEHYNTYGNDTQIAILLLIILFCYPSVSFTTHYLHGHNWNGLQTSPVVKSSTTLNTRNNKHTFLVRSEVLTAASMKMSVFGVAAECSRAAHSSAR